MLQLQFSQTKLPATLRFKSSQLFRMTVCKFVRLIVTGKKYRGRDNQLFHFHTNLWRSE